MKTEIITLTTDFGNQDAYLGQMKGAILSLAPKVRLVDITHQIKPQRVNEAAWVIYQAAQTFPTGTVHVGVVDPGVGTMRRLLAVKTKRAYFIAPDNGLLTHVLAAEQSARIRAIQNHRFFRQPVSRTFHGRDIMGPVAAALARNKATFPLLGPEVAEPFLWPITRVVQTKNCLRGEVIYVDYFGNLITNITESHLSGAKAIQKVILKKRSVLFRKTYGETQKGELLALVGSSGHLEVARNGSSAALAFRAGVGTQVQVFLT